MSEIFRVIVTGDVQVSRRILKRIPAVRASIRRAMIRLGIKLENRVKVTKLSGQVLKVRSGRLRASITSRFTEEGDVLQSLTGTNVSYGRAWELGFAGTVPVREHMRKGKPVRAHMRTVDQAPRPFLRPSIQEMRQEATADLKAATAAGLKDV